MKPTSIFIPLFLISLAIPMFFFVGPLRLSPYRLFLLLGLVPAVIIWLTNKRYKKLPSDFLILFYPIWTTLSLTVLYGTDRSIEAGGMIAIETIGAYFIARVLICTPERFNQLCKWLIFIILFLTPFALFETVTGRVLPIEIFRTIGRTYGIAITDQRWGLDRVQGPFEHPILFGVFCSMGISLAFYYRYNVQSAFQRYIRAFAVFVTAALSLSSGPLTGMSGQLLLIGYDMVTRHIVKRWQYMLAGIAALWVTIDLLSTRSPPQVFITYFAFSPHSAYNRVFIWRYGTQSIVNHPLFGIGYEEYERPWFVYSSSADMFWIVPSLQYGMPAGFALIIAFAYNAIRTSRAKIVDKNVLIQRRAMMFCLVGIFLSGWTVHYWNATYAMVVFMFGACAWFFTNQDIAVEKTADETDDDETGSKAGPRRPVKNAQARPRYPFNRSGERSVSKQDTRRSSQRQLSSRRQQPED